jgi:YfiH family protein
MPRVTTGLLNGRDGVRHAFFTRNGGVSEGIYATNNCGFGSRDAPAAVAENRARCARKLEVEPENLLTLAQIHSNLVVRVERPWSRDAFPEADAMVTREAGIALGILSADCAPLLLADTQARVIGAAHAGWKGALGGIVAATVEAMCELGADPDRIAAAIGPAIGRQSYEVDAAFPRPFLEQDPGNAAFFFPAAKPGKQFFDLKGYVAARLAQAGVGDFVVMPNDTCADAARFFSYRRACQRGEEDYGRLLSAIALEG